MVSPKAGDRWIHSTSLEYILKLGMVAVKGTNAIMAEFCLKWWTTTALQVLNAWMQTYKKKSIIQLHRKESVLPGCKIWSSLPALRMWYKNSVTYFFQRPYMVGWLTMNTVSQPHMQPCGCLAFGISGIFERNLIVMAVSMMASLYPRRGPMEGSKSLACLESLIVLSLAQV